MDGLVHMRLAEDSPFLLIDVVVLVAAVLLLRVVGGVADNVMVG